MKNSRITEMTKIKTIQKLLLNNSPKLGTEEVKETVSPSGTDYENIKKLIEKYDGKGVNSIEKLLSEIVIILQQSKEPEIVLKTYWVIKSKICDPLKIKGLKYVKEDLQIILEIIGLIANDDLSCLPKLDKLLPPHTIRKLLLPNTNIEEFHKLALKSPECARIAFILSSAIVARVINDNDSQSRDDMIKQFNQLQRDASTRITGEFIKQYVDNLFKLPELLKNYLSNTELMNYLLNTGVEQHCNNFEEAIKQIDHVSSFYNIRYVMDEQCLKTVHEELQRGLATLLNHIYCINKGDMPILLRLRLDNYYQNLSDLLTLLKPSGIDLPHKIQQMWNEVKDKIHAIRVREKLNIGDIDPQALIDNLEDAVNEIGDITIADAEMAITQACNELSRHDYHYDLRYIKEKRLALLKENFNTYCKKIEQNIQLKLDNNDISELHITDIDQALDKYHKIKNLVNYSASGNEEIKLDHDDPESLAQSLYQKINQLICKKIKSINNKLILGEISCKEIVKIYDNLKLFTHILAKPANDVIRKLHEQSLAKLDGDIKNIMYETICLKIKLLKQQMSNIIKSDRRDNGFYINDPKLLADIKAARSCYSQIETLINVLCNKFNRELNSYDRSELEQIREQLCTIEEFLPISLKKRFNKIISEEYHPMKWEDFKIDHERFLHPMSPPPKLNINLGFCPKVSAPVKKSEKEREQEMLEWLNSAADNVNESEKDDIARFFGNYINESRAYFPKHYTKDIAPNKNNRFAKKLNILFNDDGRLKKIYRGPKYARFICLISIQKLNEQSRCSIYKRQRNELMDEMKLIFSTHKISAQCNPYFISLRRIEKLIKIRIKVSKNYSGIRWEKTREVFEDLLDDLIISEIENNMSSEDLKDFIGQIYNLDKKYLKLGQDILTKLLAYAAKDSNQLDHDKINEAILSLEQQHNTLNPVTIPPRCNNSWFSFFSRFFSSSDSNNQSDAQQLHNEFKNDFFEDRFYLHDDDAILNI